MGGGSGRSATCGSHVQMARARAAAPGGLRWPLPPPPHWRSPWGLAGTPRDQVKAARLVANPGCYPTSVQLALHPLLKQGLITAEDIIIDSKSGGLECVRKGGGGELRAAFLLAATGPNGATCISPPPRHGMQA